MVAGSCGKIFPQVYSRHPEIKFSGQILCKGGTVFLAQRINRVMDEMEMENTESQNELIRVIAEEIVAEGNFFKIAGRTGKPEIYRRQGNSAVKETEKTSLLKKICAEKIQAHALELKDASALRKITNEILYRLELTEGFIRDEADFLPPPLSIPCLNGEIDFVSGIFKPDDGETLRLKRINACFADCYINDPLPSLFEELLRNGTTNYTLNTKDNDARYNCLLDFLAYLIFPENPLRKMAFITGVPHSGKTTLCTILQNILGEYADVLDSHSIMRQSRSNPEMRPDLIGLTDKLLIYISELDNKRKLYSRLVKNLTGNDPMPVRKAHSNEMQKESLKGKILVVSNYYPKFEDADDAALMERLVIFDWYNSVNDENSIFDLAEQMTTDENRSRIFSVLAARAVSLYKNNRFHFEVHSSFAFNPNTGIDYAEAALKAFFCNVLFCSDGNFVYTLMGNNKVCRDDIYLAYHCYHVQATGQPVETLLTKREFYKKLRDYLDKFPFVRDIRHPDNVYYEGVSINPQFIRRPLRVPQNGNFGKPPKQFPQY
jgi:hypothetical protein